MSQYVDPFIVRQRSIGGGPGFVAGIAPGIVTVDGVAAAADVYLFDQHTRTLAGRTRAAADGTYRIDGIAMDLRRWTLFAEDLTGEHNMVIRAHITAAAA